jgi:hypothetical protein
MSKLTDKQRIIALQKALRVARSTLQRLEYQPGVADALDEINKLDWKTAPSGLQGLCGHGANVQ